MQRRAGIAIVSCVCSYATRKGHKRGTKDAQKP